MVTPGGSDFWISSIFSCTRAATAREFSPISIITTPVTASPRPSRVTAPWRTIGAKATRPRLRT